MVVLVKQHFSGFVHRAADKVTWRTQRGPELVNVENTLNFFRFWRYLDRVRDRSQLLQNLKRTEILMKELVRGLRLLNVLLIQR